MVNKGTFLFFGGDFSTRRAYGSSSSSPALSSSPVFLFFFCGCFSCFCDPGRSFVTLDRAVYWYHCPPFSPMQRLTISATVIALEAVAAFEVIETVGKSEVMVGVVVVVVVTVVVLEAVTVAGVDAGSG